MKKTVTIKLEIDNDFLSTIHGAVGDLVAVIEDNDLFTIKAVEVDDAPTIKLPGLGGATYR